MSDVRADDVGGRQKNRRVRGHHIDGLVYLYRGAILGIKRYTAQQAIDILVVAAQGYKERLAGRVFVIIYKDLASGTIEHKRMKFTQNNFQHLTGIKYADYVSPKDFYKMCLNKMLSPNKIRFNPNGFTNMKLSVLNYLPELLYNKFWIGESINNDIHINADYFAGDTRCIVSLGFRRAKEDYPVSLKRQSIREVVKKENPVCAVLVKEITDKDNWEFAYIEHKLAVDKYNEIKNIAELYLGKNIEKLQELIE